MREKILVLARPTPGDPEFYERWKVLGEVYTEASPLTDITVLVVDQHSRPIPPGMALPALKYVCSATTGHTHLKWAEERGIPTITLRGELEFLRSIRSVSEFTIKALLEISRPDAGEAHLLNGKTIGIIGMGRIGKHVAILAHAFGMKVYGVDLESSRWQWERAFQCDFVSIHVNEEPKNVGLISKLWIDKMPRHAWFLNTARASVVDEQALYDAVKSRTIAGAYLDVTDRVWDIPNVYYTRHRAGHTLEDRMRTDQFIVDKAKRALGYRRTVRVMTQ